MPFLDAFGAPLASHVQPRDARTPSRSRYDKKSSYECGFRVLVSRTLPPPTHGVQLQHNGGHVQLAEQALDLRGKQKQAVHLKAATAVKRSTLLSWVTQLQSTRQAAVGNGRTVATALANCHTNRSQSYGQCSIALGCHRVRSYHSSRVQATKICRASSGTPCSQGYAADSSTTQPWGLTRVQ